MTLTIKSKLTEDLVRIFTQNELELNLFQDRLVFSG